MYISFSNKRDITDPQDQKDQLVYQEQKAHQEMWENLVFLGPLAYLEFQGKKDWKENQATRDLMEALGLLDRQEQLVNAGSRAHQDLRDHLDWKDSVAHR